MPALLGPPQSEEKPWTQSAGLALRRVEDPGIDCLETRLQSKACCWEGPSCAIGSKQVPHTKRSRKMNQRKIFCTEGVIKVLEERCKSSY